MHLKEGEIVQERLVLVLLVAFFVLISWGIRVFVSRGVKERIVQKEDENTEEE